MTATIKIIAKILVIIFVLSLVLLSCSSEKPRNDASNSIMQSGGSLPGGELKSEQTGQSAGASADPHGQSAGASADPPQESQPKAVQNAGNENIEPPGQSGDSAGLTERQGKPQAIDLNEVKPNEAGRIMVVMFHNFIEKYEKGDKEYTTTFYAFRELLNTLYDMNYRLLSLNDYLEGNIGTPAGCIPIVFTFDDGTSGQFNLIEESGSFKANPRSAVGILEEFNKTHPDFGIKGTFFVNLGNQTFGTVGTLEQRLEYLVGKGFEIGNHTYSHINLKKEGKTAEIIQREIGGNQKKMYELMPGYKFSAFSLPYGAPAKELAQYVIKGEYEGVEYENAAIMEVGANPAPSPFSVKFYPLSIPRVRATGIEPVDADLAWWLKNFKRDNQYVSDGNPDTVTVPESYAEYVNKKTLNGRKLIVY